MTRWLLLNGEEQTRWAWGSLEEAEIAAKQWIEELEKDFCMPSRIVHIFATTEIAMVWSTRKLEIHLEHLFEKEESEDEL